ncbi:MAG: NAD(+)/NADH kinase [Myxococcaceae bacterium]
MKTIALIARPKKDEAVALAREIIARFPDRRFLTEPHLAEPLGRTPDTVDDLRGSTELVVVLGGDGTLIHAARLFRGRSVPILGINLGSLGFMTEIPVAEAISTLEQVLHGRSRIDSRMKLTCRLYRGDALILDDEVLNDVVINKSGVAKITSHETWLDQAYVATFNADGVIFATPTGSTAYSLSAGGPIVHPSVDCVVVTPICPHALTQRPVVVPGDQLLTLKLTSDLEDVHLTVDGQVGHMLKKGDRVEVQKSANRLMLVRNPKLDYFAILREKLRWGER